MIVLRFRTSCTKEMPGTHVIDPHDTILTQMFDSSPAGMSLTIGPEHVYARVNRKFHEITGIEESVLGRKACDVTPEIEEQGYLRIIDQVYQTGKAHTGIEAAFRFKKSTGDHCEIFFDFCFNHSLIPRVEV